jgi:organic hydroperoxide reductase OsmC/OhrA
MLPRSSPGSRRISAPQPCHQLWYLHLCADAGIAVQDYSDSPTGLVIEQPDGAGQFEAVTLRPHARLAAGSNEELARRLHDAAAEKCAIARSMAFKVNHEPTFEIVRS